MHTGRSDAKIGLIVNPIAGMGGSVGLKGTDGKETLEKAIELGATPISLDRATIFLKSIDLSLERIQLITYPRDMGEEEAKDAGFSPKVVGKISRETGPSDTKRAVRDICELDIDLLVFCGGDGTARDILDCIDPEIPVLGVPSGVKMYSGVFARTPQIASRVATRYLREGLELRESEVMDIDEEALRRGKLTSKLHGYQLVPHEPSLIQNPKMPISGEDEAENKRSISRHVIDKMDPKTVFLLGPGSTVNAVAENLEIESTTLGVDIVQGRSTVAKDVNEEQILDYIQGKETKIVLSPLGSLGSLIGRGNKEISSRVIREIGSKNIIVVATRSKLRSLPMSTIWVDSGDEKLNEELRGHMRVVVGYNREKLVKVN